MIKKIVFSLLITNVLFGFDMSVITSVIDDVTTKGMELVSSSTDGQKINVDKECKNMFESYDVNYKAALSISAKYAVSNSSTFTTWLTKDSNTSADEASRAFKEYAKLIAKESFWIPIEAEKIYGELTYKNRLNNNSIILPSTKNKKYQNMYKKINIFLKQYNNSLKKEKFPFDLKVFITTGTRIAETTPYGYIFISKDLIINKRYKTILAHEIAHVAKRHAVKELQYRLIKTYSSATDIIKFIKDINGNELEKIIQIENAIKIVATTFNNYSIHQELEADACGLKKLTSINKHKKSTYVSGIIDNIKYMSPEEVDVGKDSDREHPSKLSRIKNIKLLEKSL